MGALQLSLSPPCALQPGPILLHADLFEAYPSFPPKKHCILGEQRDVKKEQGRNTAAGTEIDWEEGGVKFARHH